ncbi:MAG: hypothetical protein CMJ69_00895 [Planctomycetaceae bacterium]|nr:hypothetical protein [Planctomycetaceae bacterium]
MLIDLQQSCRDQLFPFRLLLVLIDRFDDYAKAAPTADCETPPGMLFARDVFGEGRCGARCQSRNDQQQPGR